MSEQGILSNEALHWLDNEDEIMAFDLAQEEKHKFRKRGGLYLSIGVCAGGIRRMPVSLARYHRLAVGDCIGVWVMREYDVHDSWTKLYSLKFSDPLDKPWWYSHVLIMETSMGAEIFVGNNRRGVVKIRQKEEDKCSIYIFEGSWSVMIHYED